MIAYRTLAALAVLSWAATCVAEEPSSAIDRPEFKVRNQPYVQEPGGGMRQAMDAALIPAEDMVVSTVPVGTAEELLSAVPPELVIQYIDRTDFEKRLAPIHQAEKYLGPLPAGLTPDSYALQWLMTSGDEQAKKKLEWFQTAKSSISLDEFNRVVDLRTYRILSALGRSKPAILRHVEPPKRLQNAPVEKLNSPEARPMPEWPGASAGPDIRLPTDDIGMDIGVEEGAAEYADAPEAPPSDGTAQDVYEPEPIIDFPIEQFGEPSIREIQIGGEDLESPEVRKPRRVASRSRRAALPVVAPSLREISVEGSGFEDAPPQEEVRDVGEADRYNMPAEPADPYIVNRLAAPELRAIEDESEPGNVRATSPLVQDAWVPDRVEGPVLQPIAEEYVEEPPPVPVRRLRLPAPPVIAAPVVAAPAPEIEPDEPAPAMELPTTEVIVPDEPMPASERRAVEPFGIPSGLRNSP